MARESIYLKKHKYVAEGVIYQGIVTDVTGDTFLKDTNIPATHVADIWNGERLFIFAGTGAGQTRKIKRYDGAGEFELYDAWNINPDTTSRYQVVSGDGVIAGAPGDATAARQVTIINDIGTVNGKVDTIDTVVDGIQADLDNPTDGLGALKTEIEAVNNKVDTIGGYQDVVAPDSTGNAQMRDVLGNKEDTAVGAPSDYASVISYLKALLGTGLVDGAKNIGFNRDLPYLTEFFEDETISAAVWDETVTNTGSITFVVEDGYKYVNLSTGATDMSTAVLNTDQRFEFRPNSFNIVQGVITRIVLEWDMRLTNITNMLNDSVLFGFGNSKTSIRTSNNIAGFILDGDVLKSITDNGGTEELTDVSAGITVTEWNKYRITALPGNTVQFYINDTLVATHNNAASLPNDAMYIIFHNANDSAADADVDVAHIRQWYSE